ncbi:ribosomal protein L13-domain-containing protein [Gigaspora rosea]|uniref:Ribosomal protein L13-domain-containing protein n=1 Tax=Gigaspora rosea TaxID=44941 RepID=A0A397UB68_9GLOM|nr:ribosomal protein L13-domain-containing protein [Gigaspora rosea]
MSQAIGNTALAYVRAWHLVDAKQRILGRMSANIATTLMGKHKPIYDPASDCGDYVVVINAKEVAVTGKKAEQKLYRHHSGYPGGLKTISYKIMLEKKPDEIIRKAVSGMLPKNRLRYRRLNRLFIFPDDKHPYEKNILKYYDYTLNELSLPDKVEKKIQDKSKNQDKKSKKNKSKKISSAENIDNGKNKSVKESISDDVKKDKKNKSIEIQI